MKQADVEIIEGAMLAGIERAIERLYDDSPDWGRRLRVADPAVLIRAATAGAEMALERTLLNPFPRRGQLKAVLNNARPQIRAAIEAELLKLL